VQLNGRPSTVKCAEFRTRVASSKQVPPNDLNKTHTNSTAASPWDATRRLANQRVNAGLAVLCLSALLVGLALDATAVEPTTPFRRSRRLATASSGLVLRLVWCGLTEARSRSLTATQARRCQEATYAVCFLQGMARFGLERARDWRDGKTVQSPHSQPERGCREMWFVRSP